MQPLQLRYARAHSGWPGLRAGAQAPNRTNKRQNPKKSRECNKKSAGALDKAVYASPHYAVNSKEAAVAVSMKQNSKLLQLLQSEEVKREELETKLGKAEEAVARLTKDYSDLRKKSAEAEANWQA